LVLFIDAIDAAFKVEQLNIVSEEFV